MTPDKLPKARVSKVSGDDRFAWATETCPWCAGWHLHRREDLSDPRRCEVTGKNFMIYHEVREP